MPADDMAFLIEQEFREIPLDALGPQNTRCLGFELHEERMRVRSVDVDLREHGKTYAVILFAKARDVGFASWLLCAELITGKAKHSKAPVFVLAVQVFEPRILRSKAALAGGIHDQ